MVGGVIGLAQVAGVTLDTAVGHQLHRPHHQTVAVVVRRLVFAVEQRLAKLGLEGEHHQSLGNHPQPAEQRQPAGQFLAHPARLGRGDATGGVFIGCGLEQAIGIHQAHVLHLRHNFQPGGLLQQTVGFARARHPADDPTHGVGRAGINSHRGQRQAIGHHHMAGYMHGDHGMVGRYRIELGAGRVTLLRQQGVIVTETHHPLAGGSQVGLLPERREHLLHGVAGTDRRAVQVRGNLFQTRAGKMPVGIDKTRQEGAPAEIHHLGALLGQRHDLLRAAHRLDAVSPHRQCLDDAVLGVHRQDIAVDEQLLGGWLRQSGSHPYQHPEADDKRRAHRQYGFPVHGAIAPSV